MEDRIRPGSGTTSEARREPGEGGRRESVSIEVSVSPADTRKGMRGVSGKKSGKRIKRGRKEGGTDPSFPTQVELGIRGSSGVRSGGDVGSRSRSSSLRIRRRSAVVRASRRWCDCRSGRLGSNRGRSRLRICERKGGKQARTQRCGRRRERGWNEPPPSGSANRKTRPCESPATRDSLRTREQVRKGQRSAKRDVGRSEQMVETTHPQNLSDVTSAVSPPR